MAFVDDVVLITEHLSYMTPAIKEGQKFLNFKEFSVNDGRCGSLDFCPWILKNPRNILMQKYLFHESNGKSIIYRPPDQPHQ